MLTPVLGSFTSIDSYDLFRIVSCVCVYASERCSRGLSEY